MSRGRRKTVLLVALLIAVLSKYKVYAQDSCTTQSGDSGICVPAWTCKTITDLLKSAPKPLTPEVSNYVRQSRCGSNDVYHVCCDPDRATSEETQTQRSPESKIRKGQEKSQAQEESGEAILRKTKCGKSDGDKISNGEDTNLSEFPWMALLVYSDGVKRTLDCGGSLITDRYVLTAAHCLITGGRKLVSVRLGEHNTDEEIDCVGFGVLKKCAPSIQEIDIEEAIYHQEYDRFHFINDIGLIRLVSKATINTSVKPICLPITERSRAHNLDRMIIAGWGKIETGTPATVLQKATVQVRKNDYCKEKLKLQLTERHLCAGGGESNIDTCLGDSAGPIFFSARYRLGVRYIQYGVVSSGAKICGTEFPSLFSRVTYYLPWIYGNISP